MPTVPQEAGRRELAPRSGVAGRWPRDTKGGVADEKGSVHPDFWAGCTQGCARTEGMHTIEGAHTHEHDFRSRTVTPTVYCQRLRLKVNRSKSAVAPVGERSFLGFCIRGQRKLQRHIAPKALQRFKARVRLLTRRTLGVEVSRMIAPLAKYMRGWRVYFGFCQTPWVLHELDAWIRRRLRMVLWKQWRRGPNRFAQLRKRGVSRDHAAIAAGARSGHWRMSRYITVQQALPNAYFFALGLPRLEAAYRA